MGSRIGAVVGGGIGISMVFHALGWAGEFACDNFPASSLSRRECERNAQFQKLQQSPASPPSAPAEATGAREPPVPSTALPALTPSPTVATPPTASSQGPVETWNRFRDALRRSDKDAALQEVSPASRERYRAILDALMPGPPANPGERK